MSRSFSALATSGASSADFPRNFAPAAEPSWHRGGRGRGKGKRKVEEKRRGGNGEEEGKGEEEKGEKRRKGRRGERGKVDEKRKEREEKKGEEKIVSH